MGWGDAPGATTEELASALAQFDPTGMAQALGRDEDHTMWFDAVCEALLPNYTFSLGSIDGRDGKLPASLPIIPVRRGIPEYTGPALPWPPGWANLWGGVHLASSTDTLLPSAKKGPAGAPSDVAR
jgi:hypothetical protein